MEAEKCHFSILTLLSACHTLFGRDWPHLGTRWWQFRWLAAFRLLHEVLDGLDFFRGQGGQLVFTLGELPQINIICLGLLHHSQTTPVPALLLMTAASTVAMQINSIDTLINAVSSVDGLTRKTAQI